MNRTNSLGRYTRSMGAKEICILLVNDDYICRSIVSCMLDHCRYEVFSYERDMDALNIIWEKKDALELVLTNIHRTYVKRFGIIEYIENKFKLQIILMSPDVDNIKNISRGGGNGVTVYILKSLSMNELNDLWATALAREKGKRELSLGKLVRVENVPSLVASVACKRTIEINEQNGNVEKKSRVVWTKEMHQKFLEAIAQLGHDKAFPKKIVELMNVPGLTRENVASHLQKYRMCMKRAQEGFTGSSYDFIDPFGFNTLQGQFQQSHWNPSQLRTINTTTTHFSLNRSKSSFLNTLQFKPEQNFRVYGNEKKNVLVSIEHNKLPSNTTFAGFRLAGDGKSVDFRKNGHFDGDQIIIVNDCSIQCPSASSDQQRYLLSEMGNDNLSHYCPSFSLGFTPQQTNSDEVTSFTQVQSAASWTEWAEQTSFSPQLPPSGNNVNANTEIFNDFTSTSFPPEFCELGTIGDDDGFDTTSTCIFDDLLF